MFPFAMNSAFNATQTTVACRLLISIARADGMHPREEAMIRAFYEGGDDQVLDFDKILAQNDQTVGDVSMFELATHKEMLLSLCIMTAYADGRYSQTEANLIDDIARKLGIDTQRLDFILANVKDSMLASLAHLPDAGSVAKVAKELG